MVFEHNMHYEFSFSVRDRLKDYLSNEDFKKLEIISESPRRPHSKEILLDIITYCSLGDYDQGKLCLEETISLLDKSRRALIVQRLVYYYWRKCFIKTKLAIDKKPEQIENCKNFHTTIRSYRDLLNNFNGFHWTWYTHFVTEIHNLMQECVMLNEELI